jgi:hypothetical protein
MGSVKLWNRHKDPYFCAHRHPPPFELLRLGLPRIGPLGTISIVTGKQRKTKEQDHDVSTLQELDARRPP